MLRVPEVLGALLVLSLVAGASAGVTVAQGGGETVTVTVAVRDRAGNTISNADLDVEWDGGSTTATTAGNGKAFVDVPAGAEVTIRVTHPRYVRNNPYVIDSAAEREVDVQVYRKSTVRLEVSDDDGSVADARVRIQRGGLDIETGRTGPNGVFESDTVEAGRYTVVVSKPGYYTREKPLEIDGDITNRVALRRGSVTVGVRVIDPHFDPPQAVSGATVTLTDVATERTGRSGNVSVTAPVNTETTLRVTRDGYRTAERDLTVGEEATNVSVGISRTPSVTLESANERVVAGERVVLTATNAYGEPASVATVYLDGERVGTTDGEGEARVRIDDPGEHTLYVTKDGVRSNEVGVEAINADGGTDTADATATASPTDEPTPTATTTSDSSPGFTPILALLAILLVAARFARR
ncbi:carboxypeptidase regulatory-like domain-containing protein [Haloplanus rubicundus]|uniref:Carboxypeptidase regulatory-like domain-containing protein n=1 Tax=Haloplanus rubicundus TaxID=1547898 RepID=A0A345E7D0_9EURY|nr:carboxypeptidase-like regulatory domain-containing protein [Haloplanus rubicundus]AXG08102.1 carboxypeptidase regulatory-like domain-containing protein [Haloplanus rubicundus]